MNPCARSARGQVAAFRSGLAGLAVACCLAACGGGGGGGDDDEAGPTQALPQSSTLASACAAPRPASTVDENGRPYADRAGSVTDEKAWLRSWVDETYLWYEDVRGLDAATLDARRYATAIGYFDVLKSPLVTASGQPKDRFHFTYPTAEWVALSQNGVSFGYGFQIALLAVEPPRRAVIASTEPGTPAAAAGLARGAEILSVDGVDLVNDASQAGVDALNAGLFPSAAGSHSFTYRDGAGATQTVTLSAAALQLTPVQHVKTLPAPNDRVGYLLFNDHVATSERLLVDAVAQLRAAGIDDLVLDLRYNGGGFLDIASQLAYMIAGPEATSGRAFETLGFNDKNPFELDVAERTTPFHAVTLGLSATAGEPLPTLGLRRVYVLAGGDTCSASESIVNGLRGVGVEVVLVGETTCGKPYGSYPTDNCGTTYFALQFQGFNALGFGDYADGFAPTCRVADDFGHALGDPGEARLAAALSLRAGGACPAATALARAAAAPRGGAAGPRIERPPLRDNRFYRVKR